MNKKVSKTIAVISCIVLIIVLVVANVIHKENINKSNTNESDTNRGGSNNISENDKELDQLDNHTTASNSQGNIEYDVDALKELSISSDRQVDLESEIRYKLDIDGDEKAEVIKYSIVDANNLVRIYVDEQIIFNYQLDSGVDTTTAYVKLTDLVEDDNKYELHIKDTILYSSEDVWYPIDIHTNWIEFKEDNNGKIVASYTNGNEIIGLPHVSYYYDVYNFDKNLFLFVKEEQSVYDIEHEEELMAELTVYTDKDENSDKLSISPQYINFTKVEVIDINETNADYWIEIKAKDGTTGWVRYSVKDYVGYEYNTFISGERLFNGEDIEKYFDVNLYTDVFGG